MPDRVSLSNHRPQASFPEGTNDKRFCPWTRQRTGTPLIFRAYVVDGATRQIIRACSHNHARRNGHTGQFYAERCAERMVQQQLRDLRNTEGVG